MAAGFSAFWYLGYHTLFWLDLYLTGSEEGFATPEPFDLVEMDAGEVLPRIYTRAELLRYLEDCRRKCRETIATLSTGQAYRLCKFPWGELPFAELLLYTMRHVQEHAAQLRMFLGQQAGSSAERIPGAGVNSYRQPWIETVRAFTRIPIVWQKTTPRKPSGKEYGYAPA